MKVKEFIEILKNDIAALGKTEDDELVIVKDDDNKTESDGSYGGVGETDDGAVVLYIEHDECIDNGLRKLNTNMGTYYIDPWNKDAESIFVYDADSKPVGKYDVKCYFYCEHDSDEQASLEYEALCEQLEEDFEAYINKEGCN